MFASRNISLKYYSQEFCKRWNSIVSRNERKQRIKEMREAFNIQHQLESMRPLNPKVLTNVFKDPALAYPRKTRMMSFDPQWRESLVDEFGREHNYLRISLTERCNFRCQYCMPEEGIPLSPDDKMMKSHEIVSLANLFVRAGMDKIRLTGGEPTIHPEFEKIVQGIANANGLRTFAMTTNGLKLSQYISLLKQAKMNAVNVSLDTLQEDKFIIMTRRQGFQKVFKSIIDLIDAEFCQVKVNVVVMKGINDEEILDFVNLTKTLPIHIRFIEFMPFDSNNWSEEKIVSKAEILKIIADKHPNIEPVQDLTSNETAKIWSIPGHVGAVGVISSMTDKFCSSCNRLRLTADGHLKNCLFGTEEFDLLTKMREEGPRGDWEEAVLDIVGRGVKAKQKTHGGMDFLKRHVKENRPMVKIGG